MQPNQDIWGAPETWGRPNYNDVGGPVCSRINGYLPVFDSTESGNGKFMLSTGVTKGILQFGEDLDQSCCPWRIKGDSYWISGVKQISFEGDRYNPKISYAYRIDARLGGCPLMISPLTTLDGALYTPSYIWKPDYSAPGFTPAENQNTSPLLNFDYQRIVIVPSIRASASPGGSTTRYGLDEYLESGINSKPYVQSLNFRIWTGTPGSMTDSDEQLKMHLWGAYANGVETSVTSLASDFLNYQSFWDGDSYTSDGRGDSYVSYNSSDIEATAAATNDAIYARYGHLIFIACPDDATISASSSEIRASWRADPEWIVQQYAALGFWIWGGGDGTGSISPNAWDPTDPDEHTIIPLFDEWGTTTGEYLRGEAALQAPAALWRSDVYERNIYHGEPPVDPTIYDDNITQLPSGYVGQTAKLYAMQYGVLSNLMAYLNDVSATLQSENESLQKFLTNNPIDIISGLLYYPFDIYAHTIEPGPTAHIILGNVETDIDGRRLNASTIVFDAGACTYYPPNGLEDFRSYAPYSSAELYIPYCGSVKIDPSDYIGHTISVKYLIDLPSGACLALVYRDQMVLDSIAGQIGINLPVTGIQTATLQASQKQASMQAQSAKVAAAAAVVGVGAAFFTAGTSLALTAAAVGGATALYGASQKLDASEYNLEHQQIPYKSVGTSSPATSMQNEQACRLIIKRPVMLTTYDAATYGHTKGFACLITSQLGQFTGFTIVSNADLSAIPATAKEKEQLLKLLQSGIFM